MHSPAYYFDRQPFLLLIDEDLRALHDLEGIANGAGYLTRCCSSAAEAVTAAKENLPDLILCSVFVNGQSGMEICERIKQSGVPAEIPTMFLSTNQIPDIIRRHGPHGGSYCLRKPFDPEVLLELLDRDLMQCADSSFHEPQ